MYAFLDRAPAFLRLAATLRYEVTSVSPRTTRIAFIAPQRNVQRSRYTSSFSTTASATPPKVAIIGAGGNMATALINGLLSQRTPPVIHASSPSLQLLSHLPEAAKRNQTTSNTEACRQADLVLLCVKPNIAPIVLSEIAPILHQSQNDPVLVSIVAGLSTSSLQQHMSSANQSHHHIPIVRAMPNLPASTQSACTVICANEAAQQHHIECAVQILSAVGNVYHTSESLMASATGLSGAGVAYVFMMAEALADAGVKHGFSREHALAMAADTIKGAGDLLQQKNHPALLRNMVESPGGVTIVGTSQLEERGFRAAVGAAVDAAVNKAQQMGDN